jgi:uncharacterized membrane protein
MFFDILGMLIGVAFTLLVALTILAVPIFALVRTFQLSSRLSRLEKALDRLLRGGATGAEEAADREAVAAVPIVRPATPAPPPEEEFVEMQLAEQDHAVSGFEALIGGRALGWIAVVLLLIAAALFFRVVFEKGLIGPLGRVAIGLGVGLLLTGAGYVFHRRGWRVFSQMLTAAGIVLLYLTTFASFGFYELIPSSFAAAPFMIAVIAEALLLAVLYESPAIALMAVVGGLLTPLLLATDEDRYVQLFGYLGLLNAGVVLLVLLRNWWASATVALVGTHGIFWLWYAERYHPAKRPVALVFEGVVFGLYLAHTVLSQLVRGRAADIEALIRLVLNAGLFAAAGYVLLEPDFGLWMGSGAVGMAIVYALLAWVILASRPDHAPLLAVTLATAMGFIAMVFPLQTEAAWIALGWAAQGLALWWFGLRIRSIGVRVMGGIFLALAAGRLVFVDTLAGPPHTEPFLPIFNRYGLPALGVIAGIVGAAALSYVRRPRRLSLDFVVMRVLSLAGFLLLWMVVSIETYDFFAVGDLFFVKEIDLARMALSLAWAIYAVGTLLVGFRFHSRPLRWLALGVFALTLLKVVFFDTASLTGFYRVTVFFVLAVVMGGAAWAYQKVKRVLSTPASEDNP